ncbi:MAG TPA: hypothetical protein VLH77_05810 [Gammaproteobacteria bacterium]|nr:hypothetical protein [Gammaproteobacteria bacterium]
MEKLIKKLFLLLKLCVFNILVLLSCHAYAEYYLVYSTPDYYNLCDNCRGSYAHRHRSHRIVKKSSHVAHRVRHMSGGLSVSYPLTCLCCSPSRVARSQWGDYVVFTTRPADKRYGIPEEERPTYNPDLSTADDGRADLEIN